MSVDRTDGDGTDRERSHELVISADRLSKLAWSYAAAKDGMELEAWIQAALNKAASDTLGHEIFSSADISADGVKLANIQDGIIAKDGS